MADEVIDFLRVRFDRLEVKIDTLAADLNNIKVRLSALEHDVGFLRIGMAELNSRFDRMDARIERRLDLREVV